MNSQTSKREENNIQKKVKHRSRADSGPLLELLSPSGRTLERVTKSSDDSPPNKLSKSKSDNILRLFRRSSDKHRAKPLSENPSKSEDSTSPPNPVTDPASKSNLKTKGAQKSYKAFRSGSGPLILIKQPRVSDLKADLTGKECSLPEANKIVSGHSELTTREDKNNVNSIKTSKTNTYSIEISSAKLTNSSIVEKKAAVLPTESKVPETYLSNNSNKESVFNKYLPSNKESSKKVLDQTTPKVDEKFKLQNVKENTIGITKSNLITDNISRNVVDQSLKKLYETSITQSDNKQKSDKNSITVGKNLGRETNHLESKGTQLLKRLLGQGKSVTLASKETAKEPVNKVSQEESQISKISKLKEHWEELQHSKDKEPVKNKLKSPVSVDKRGTKEQTEPLQKYQQNSQLGQNLKENEKLVHNDEHRKLTKTSNINQKSRPNNTTAIEPSTKVTKQSEVKIDSIIDKLPPKCPSTKKSLPIEPPISISNQQSQSWNGNQREAFDSEEYLIDNESFHNQQSIRENQEKKILELHLKHLQEIQKLRSQAKDYRITNSSTPDPPPAVLLNKRKQYLFTNANEPTSQSSTLPPCKLIRSVTYDNPSDFYNPSSESDTSVGTPDSFTTNSLPRKGSKKYFNATHIIGNSTSHISDRKFSFSSYLIKTRSNSVGEKDKKLLIEEKEKDEIKIELPKRVHFPDDSKLDSTNVEKKQEKNIDSLVNTDGRISTISNHSKSSSAKGKAKNISILKKSSSVDDSKPVSVDLTAPPIDFPKELINLSAKVFELTTVAAPVKPPRLGKGLRRAQSVDEGCDMRQVMSSCGKKEAAVRQSSPNHEKENSEPVPIHVNKSDNNFHIPNQNHNQRFTESQKRKYQQESTPVHSESKPTFTPEISVKKIEKSESKGAQVPTRPPQPPSRGQKPYLKGQTGQISSLGDKAQGPPNDSEGQLVTACKVGEEEQILKLLKDLSKTSSLEASLINQIDHSKRTALSHTCSNGYFKVVEFLTAQSQIDLNLVDSEGNTPLHYAAQGGHVEIVSHLVNTCNRQVDLDVRNNLGFTPLMKAALQGRTKIAKILLFAGASPHLRDYGKGLCAVEWAKYTGRSTCSELIDSVQRSCSSHIKDRWSSDLDIKISSHSGSNSSFTSYQDNKDSWLKHKIKKAFNKSESRKEFNVASNLPTIAVCVSSPILPNQVQSPEARLPKVQVTEVAVPDYYIDPETCQSRSTTSENSEESLPEEESCGESGTPSPEPESKELPPECGLDLNDIKEEPKPTNKIPTIEVQLDNHGSE